MLCLCAASLAAQAQMYKWVDDKGVTHYSAEPPPEGAKGAAKVEIKTAPAAPSAGKDDWKAKELQSRQLRAKQEAAEDKAKAQDGAQRRERCMRAADRLDTYRSQIPVYRFNDRGEKVYIEDRERPGLIAQAQADVDQYCDR
jgi:conjugal transfer/entry exclusion protein